MVVPARVGYLIGAAAVAFAVGMTTWVFGPFLMETYRARQIAMSGTAAMARVISLQDTNRRVNYQPVIAIHLEVMPEGRPPYQAVVRRVVTVIDAGRLTPGTVVAVRFDPAHPERVVITGDMP